jgi:hypothetical protein
MAGQPDGPIADEQVAVFIDLENLAIGAGESLAGQTDTIPYNALEMLCRDYGNTSIRRAYADWSRPEFAKHQFNMAQNGITLSQVTRYGAQQKNAAAILMAVDAMEVLITHPDVGTLMLVAGDGDYPRWSSGCASSASGSASAPRRRPAPGRSRSARSTALGHDRRRGEPRGPRRGRRQVPDQQMSSAWSGRPWRNPRTPQPPAPG